MTGSKAILALLGVEDPTPKQRGAAMVGAEFMTSVTLFIRGLADVDHHDLAKPKDEQKT